MTEFYFIRTFDGRYFASRKRGWVPTLEEATLFDDRLPIDDLLKFNPSDMQLMCVIFHPIGNGKYKLKISKVEWPPLPIISSCPE